MTPNVSDFDAEIADAVRAVRAGDAQAYATIVKRFQGPLTTLCTACSAIVKQRKSWRQDAPVRAYERLDLFDVRQPMKPWLYTIAYWLAQQRRRAQGRETARQEAAAMRGQERGDAGPMDELCSPAGSVRPP